MTRHRSSSLRRLVAGAFLLVAGVATASPVPVALERLVPADPLLVVYAPSLDEIERDVVGLVERFGGEGPGEDASIFDLFEGMSGDLGDLELVMDPTKPFAAVLRLMPGMPAPLFSMMVPLRDGLTVDDVEQRLGVVPLASDEGYVVLGTDSSYRMGGSRQPMLAGIGDDDLTVRLDVEGVFRALGPMVDMVVQMALQSPGDDGSPPPTDRDGVDAAMAMVNVLRDGIGTLEVVADIDGDRVELAGGVRFREDGPLALGAQPTLDEHWSDASLLDPDAALLAVSGVDLRNLESLVDAIVELVDTMDLEDDYAGTLAIDALQQKALELWMTGLRPYVTSVDFGDDGLAMRWIEVDDTPAETQRAMRELFSSLEAVGLITTWQEPRSVAGFAVETGTMRLDFDRLTAGDPDAGALDDEEREALQAMMDFFLGPTSIAAGQGRMVMLTEADPAAVDDFLGRVASNARGEVPTRLRDVREWAGPRARGVMVLDATAYFGRMITQMSTAFAETGQGDEEDWEEMAAKIAALPSTPVYGMASVDGDWLRGRLSMETEVLVRFVETMQAFYGDDATMGDDEG